MGTIDQTNQNATNGNAAGTDRGQPGDHLGTDAPSRKAALLTTQGLVTVPSAAARLSTAQAAYPGAPSETGFDVPVAGAYDPGTSEVTTTPGSFARTAEQLEMS